MSQVIEGTSWNPQMSKDPRQEMINTLNNDLKNEWKHLRFYLYHASAVTGLHAVEFKELFLEEAANEMKHVTAFSDMITGLGGIPSSGYDAEAPFPQLSDPKDIIKYAIEMETEVVANYVGRMNFAGCLLNDVDAKWLKIFLEGQIQDSREDVDKFKQILKGL